MKGGSLEGKNVTPLFPKIHINDREKGGPRAPPRDKMALYELVSVPSKRTSGGSSSSSTHLSSRSVVVGWWPSSHGSVLENNAFALSNLPGSGVLAKGTMTNTVKTAPEPEAISVIPNAEGNMWQTAKCNLFQTQDNSPFKRLCLKEVEYIRVPIFSPSGSRLGSGIYQSGFDREKFSASSTNCFSQLQDVSGIAQVRLSISDVESGEELVIAPAVKGSGAQECKEHRIMPSPLQAERDYRSLNVLSTPHDKLVTETSKYASKPANLDPKQLPFDEAGMACSGLARGDVAMRLMKLCRDEMNMQLNTLKNGTASVMRSEPCSSSSTVELHKNTYGLFANASWHQESNRLQAVQARSNRAVNGNVDIFGSIMVDSTSGAVISPEDVVGVMGQTHFWEARKALLNQQRIFCDQLFELHRLIKAQKSHAASPHVLENSLHYDKTSSTKSLEHMSARPQSAPQAAPLPPSLRPPQQPKPCQSEPLPIPGTPPLPPQLQPLQSRVDPGKDTHLADEIRAGKPPLLPARYDTSKVAVSESKTLTISTDMNSKMGMWCYPPNQWLVPVMSPSEGLIYKPFPRSCPSFIPPIYGGFGSMTTTPISGINGASGTLGSNQRVSLGMFPETSVFPAYFMPYGNPTMPCSAAVQQGVSPCVAVQSACDDLHLAMQEPDFLMVNQGSCSLPRERHGCCPRGSELHGSSDSSNLVLPERTIKDALPLFSVHPTSQELDLTDLTRSSIGQPLQVIKVKPRNLMMANESAACIFESIHEERKQVP